MKNRILLLADIHGNFPALLAIDQHLDAASFDHRVNCGDSLVYAPFPNETLEWLRQHRVLSILGNTDRKVAELLEGKPLGKPKKEEKRVMYTSTAAALDQQGRRQLLATKDTAQLPLSAAGIQDRDCLILGIHHGSPADPEEFLFADSPEHRFAELAELAVAAGCGIIVTGHSHSPYHKVVAGVHFINPGSAGRMFDGDPRSSCATIDIIDRAIVVRHWRIAYDIEGVVQELRRQRLPEIYAAMFQQGRKLN